MKLAFLGDDINSFKLDHDSTWALMLEAVAQGYEVAYAHADTMISYGDKVGAKFLSVDASVVMSREAAWRTGIASTTASSRNDLVSGHCERSEAIHFELLEDFDYIFMRKDPPVDELYIHQLRLLASLKRARVINNPVSLLRFNEKLVILEFPDLIATTLVTASRDHILGFLEQHKRIVLKPLNGKGGEGILLVNSARDLPKITELMMAQAYIPEVLTEGDKRVILVNGEIAGQLLRIPKAGDFRANMAAGGSFADTQLSSADLHICARLKPFCQQHGIVLAGIDIIGGKLTEINITSPTCLQEINRLNPSKPKIETGLIKMLKNLR